MYLEPQTFREVVASTPLVAIDLVVENYSEEVLLGRRLNRPAQGYWFVPGGRVLKNEKLDAAFVRLTECELGVRLQRESAQLLGVYEHLYRDSVFGERPDTHYIVLAYHMRLDCDVSGMPRVQHDSFRWWRREQAAACDEVHEYSRAYLLK